jgi:hypothetical protein
MLSELMTDAQSGLGYSHMTQTTLDDGERLPITITVTQGAFTLSAKLDEATHRDEVIEACDSLLDVLYGRDKNVEG